MEWLIQGGLAAALAFFFRREIRRVLEAIERIPPLAERVTRLEERVTGLEDDHRSTLLNPRYFRS